MNQKIFRLSHFALLIFWMILPCVRGEDYFSRNGLFYIHTDSPLFNQKIVAYHKDLFNGVCDSPSRPKNRFETIFSHEMKFALEMDLENQSFPNLDLRNLNLKNVKISFSNLSEMKLDNTRIDADLYEKYLHLSLENIQNPGEFFKTLEGIDQRLIADGKVEIHSSLMMKKLPDLLVASGNQMSPAEIFKKAEARLSPQASLEDLTHYLSLMDKSQLTPIDLGARHSALLALAQKSPHREKLLSQMKKSLRRFKNSHPDEVIDYLLSFESLDDIYPFIKHQLSSLNSQEDFKKYFAKIQEKKWGQVSSLIQTKLNKQFIRQAAILLPSAEAEEFFHLNQIKVNQREGLFPSLATGEGHTCAITKNDGVKCWGDHRFGITTPPEGLGTVKSLTAGQHHTCAITEQDEVKCWGYNGHGQITVPKGLGKVKSLTAGFNHTCALTEQAEVKCWGGPDEKQRTLPNGLGKVKFLAAGGGDTCAITEQDEVKCWGHGRYSNLPEGLGKVKFLAAGNYHICAITEQDEVKCWGDYEVRRTTPRQGLGKVKSLVSGNGQSCVISEQDELKCWGNDSNKESIPPEGFGKVKSLSLGENHSCAVTMDNEVKCWGGNNKGQINPPSNLGKVR